MTISRTTGRGLNGDDDFDPFLPADRKCGRFDDARRVEIANVLLHYRVVIRLADSSPHLGQNSLLRTNGRTGVFELQLIDDCRFMILGLRRLLLSEGRGRGDAAKIAPARRRRSRRHRAEKLGHNQGSAYGESAAVSTKPAGQAAIEE